MPNPTDRLDRYDGYLQQDPDNTSIAVEAFELALSLGLYARAADYLDRARIVAGDDPYLQYRRASLWAAQGRWDEALELQSDLCRRFPQDPELRAAFASLLHYAGRYEAAEEAWTDLQRDGDLPSHAWANRLRTLHFLGRLEEGLATGDGYAETLMREPEAAGVLSLIAVDSGRFEVARRWADIALGSLPDSAEALTTAGALALASKDAAGAIAALTRVVQHKPQEGRAWSSLGIAYLLMQDGAAAQGNFQRATALMPGHIGSWHGLGWACLLIGNLPQAKDAFEQALALDRNFGESHGAVAVAYALVARNEDAVRHIELALRLDPAALSARFAQAVLSGALLRPEEFQAVAARALRGVEAPDGRSLIDWIKQ
ncbi:cellulose synthase subunit BcsC [compost metagenome]